MKLTCDLCGSELVQKGADWAECSGCGMEYGPDRLQELRLQAPQPAEPQKPEEPQKPAAQKAAGGCSRKLITFLLVLGGLDLVFGIKVLGLMCGVAVLLMLLFGKSEKK